MSYVIAIANQKGGVAKTTTAVGLSGALVQEGYDVLAIDLDAQANLTIALGINPLQVRRSIADIFVNAEKLASVIQDTNLPGLELVPANKDMELSERFVPLRQNHEILLRQQLSTPEISSVYDFIVLDCPPYLGAITTNALVAAQMLIIPTQAEFFFSERAEEHDCPGQNNSPNLQSWPHLPHPHHPPRPPQSHSSHYERTALQCFSKWHSEYNYRLRHQTARERNGGYAGHLLLPKEPRGTAISVTCDGDLRICAPKKSHPSLKICLLS